VVGNRDRKQLPSKAVDYMTLPIPRAAVTEPAADDALTAYVSGRPGWLVVSPRAADAAIAVRDHVERRWAPDELALPDSESWASVADTIAAFVEETFGVRASSQAIPSVRVA
jgi:hypothetical protein